MRFAITHDQPLAFARTTRVPERLRMRRAVKFPTFHAIPKAFPA